MFHLKVTPEFGRGLYSERIIASGQTIMICELLVLSAFDTIIVNTSELKHCTFVFNETQDCLVLGLGEIFNHDDNANVIYELAQYQGRTVMVFKAARDIADGVQLFINYGADSVVNAKEYTESKSLLG